MDAAVRAAGMADTGPDPADQEPIRNIGKDEEGGLKRSSVNNSRASLPLSHRRSFSIATSRHRAGSNPGGPAPSNDGQGGEQEADVEEGEEMEWGPSHPCFPHMNPHVPKDSPLHKSTRVIRIRRDWMIAGDTAPTFSTLYPEILDPFVSEERFRELVKHVNDSLVHSFDPYSKFSILDAILGFLTGWLWDDFGLTYVKRELRKLEAWIDAFNANFTDVQIMPLRRTAYLFLDIQIPDPQISPDDVETTEVDARSTADTKSVRSASTRKKYAGRVVRNPVSRSGSVHSSRGSAGRPTEDGSHSAQPPPNVPAIPAQFLQSSIAPDSQPESGATDAPKI